MLGCLFERTMEIIYQDESIIVCIKPAGVLSTDEEGGLPSLLRAELGERDGRIRTVHRLDRVVSGLMVLAKGAKAASELSRQIREDSFQKCYLAVVHGSAEDKGSFEDLMRRDKSERKSYITDTPDKDVQEARLCFETIERAQGMSLVRIRLITGRTHQIRCQFSYHGLPLIGDRKYGVPEDDCDIALWSESLGFIHPRSGEEMQFHHCPPDVYPWNLFRRQKSDT